MPGARAAPPRHGEHVDDHQTQIAEELGNRGLSVSVEADELTLEPPARRRGAQGDDAAPTIHRSSPAASNRMPGDEHMSPPPGGWPDLDGRQRNRERRGPAAARDVSLGEHLRIAVGSHRREPGASSHPAPVHRESREPRADQWGSLSACRWPAHNRLRAWPLPRCRGACQRRPPRPGCRSYSSEEIPVWPQPPLGDSRLGSRSSECGVLLPPFGYEDDPEGLGRIKEALQGTRPALVLVGLGFLSRSG